MTQHKPHIKCVWLQWRKIIAHKVGTFIYHFLDRNEIGSQTKAISALLCSVVDLVGKKREGGEADPEANSSN